MRNITILTIVLFLSLHCNSQTFKKIDWVTDIDFLAKELPQKHYDFFTVKDKKEFLEGLDKIKLSSTELTDIEVAIRLQQLIAGFGDSHTVVNYGQLIDKNKILPLHLYWLNIPD